MQDLAVIGPIFYGFEPDPIAEAIKDVSKHIDMAECSFVRSEIENRCRSKVPFSSRFSAMHQQKNMWVEACRRAH